MKRLFDETKFINDVQNLTQFEPDFKYLIPVFRVTEDDSAEKIEKTKQNFIKFMKKFGVLVKFENPDRHEDYHDYYCSLNRKEMMKLLLYLDSVEQMKEFFEE
jgi:alcohol dehydrogenase YqhD (iron-dependent ADH family)